MGTGKSGRYLNTKGSGTSVSDFAVMHSSEGTFIYNNKTGKISRLRSGGHGQAAIDIMKRNGVEFEIVKTYPNGVRVGNVAWHYSKLKRTGIGQSWFPESWTGRDIRRAGEHVAGLKSNRRVPDGKTIYGTYKGVKIVVKRTHGTIATVFPLSIQPSRRR